MRHLIFGEATHYPIALLIKASCFTQHDLVSNYLVPLNRAGIASDQVIGFSLTYNEAGKAPVGFQKDYLAHLLPALDRLGVKTLYCCDAPYFKTLTRQTKAEPSYGYVLPCKIKGYEHMQVILGMNHQALIYNPELQSRLDLSLKTLAAVINGTYVALGRNILHGAEYPDALDDIADALDRLRHYPVLACDIEAFSLRFHEAGIGTVSFAHDQHHGTAFAVDYRPLAQPVDGVHGDNVPNAPIRRLLKRFFEAYTGRLLWHGATYDLRVLIYTLWMEHPLDTAGLLTGLQCMTQRFDDTKIIAYLATNTTAGNTLGLKYLAHEYAGNWAQEDIKDIRRIPLATLLQYNLIDALCTHYVHSRFWDTLVADNQTQIYHGLMLPSLKTIIQMELTGMPLSAVAVSETRAFLEHEQGTCLTTILGHPMIQVLNTLLQTNAMQAANAKLKVKQHALEHFQDETFNPHSNQQLQILLYEVLGLPVIDYTDTRQPATGADTLEKLVHHTQDPLIAGLLQALVQYGKVSKILSSFIPAFEAAFLKDDGTAYLHGSFNLGGTISGRLSSSDPNLQNLPANSVYGKPVKQCFQAPTGWLFCGADFSSLEDRINALLTRDENKLKVYTDGYDGHSLRAYTYFKDQMPDIGDTVASINSIEKAYPGLRQDSKGPTFALTFLGTWRTLVTNLGWEPAKAKQIEAGYRTLYATSLAWVQERIQRASVDGYAEAAFGLRIRTPLLKQTLLGHSTTPREADAEGRTLGNAVSGQSYGLLTNRAMNAVMEEVWASPYREWIKPVSMIHDANYFLIKDDVDVILWLNQHLIAAMAWQELPELHHDVVKLGAELDIFWPTWAQKLTLPNDCSENTLRALALKHREAYP